MTRDLVLDTPDGPMGLFEAAPAGTPRGGVIVVQEAFGVNAHIRDVTARAAAAGYLAVAPAYFHRAGGGAVEDYTDVASIFPLFEGLTDDGILVDTPRRPNPTRSSRASSGYRTARSRLTCRRSTRPSALPTASS